MNSAIRSLTILSVLFILIASLGLGLPDGDAKEKEAQSDFGTPDRESEESPNTQSEQESFSADWKSKGSVYTDNDFEDVSETELNETTNETSSTSKLGSITMTPSNFIPDNQTSNKTKNESNRTSTLGEKLSKGIITDNTITMPPPTYKVTVIFDSITVHDTHEGALSGDGEYDLTAYVQGMKVGLTDNSYGGGAPYAYTGALPPVGLGDVSTGETVNFDPDARVTVDLTGTIPLVIFTAGDEIDDCDRQSHPDNIQDKISGILQQPQNTWFDSIQSIARGQSLPNCDFGLLENINERLGNIVKLYFPPGQSYEPIGYGAGAHTNVISDKGDYTLRYTITVTPPTNLSPKQSADRFLNQLQSNNTFSFNNTEVVK